MEQAGVLDGVDRSLKPVVDHVVSSPRRRAFLQGRWLGHALHPLLSDFPLGAWTCTSLLDLFGGRQSRPAAQRLLVFGLVTAVPTTLAGAAEWATTTGTERRIGTAHATLNMATAALYTASLVARRRGQHGIGVTLGLAGGGTAVLGGYLGGHLAIARKVGSSDGQPE